MVTGTHCPNHKTFLTLKLSKFLQQVGCCQLQLQKSGNALYLRLPVRLTNFLPECCLQSNLPLPSWAAFESDGQMSCRGYNLDSNLGSTAWPASYNDFIEFKEIMWSFNSFRSVEVVKLSLCANNGCPSGLSNHLTMLTLTNYVTNMHISYLRIPVYNSTYILP